MESVEPNEDFEGMEDYDEGRAAPECSICGGDCGYDEDSIDWDDDQYPDNEEDEE